MIDAHIHKKGSQMVIGREIFKRETCDKCGSTWDKLDLSGTGEVIKFHIVKQKSVLKSTDY
ncbi:hypothetical protein E05_22300 [Plautia stali symbiont]|nr:hypothetical protein E05_22300 [Plautia stali symbiont]